jgi:hypothetical protein
MKKSKTPTFLLELPLEVDARHAKRLRTHLEAARCLYNAVLGEALRRMRRMRADPAWQAARSLARACHRERAAAFSHLRQRYHFSEYALHDFAKEANATWLANHIDAVTAQTLATRAYQAVNRVCLGKAHKARFRSKGRGLDSVEGKRNDTGLRFVLHSPEEGHQGWLVWGQERIPAIIDWHDPVVKHGLDHRIKYARLVRRKASSPQAKGADCQGDRYAVQLILEGTAYRKPKHQAGSDVIGLDLGPSTLAIVPRDGEARLVVLGEALAPNARQKRRLQRKLERQRLSWQDSQGYLATRRRLAQRDRKLAAHRKSLHGQLVHEIVSVGNAIRIEKISYQGWQRQFGKSVGLRAPGMFLDHLRRTVASTGGTLIEVPTRTSRLSQYCHGCRTYAKKPLAQRFHVCACGIGHIQRDLYSALLAAYLEPQTLVPSIAHDQWEGAELRLRAAMEELTQRAKEGQVLPRSVGMPRARARLPQSLEEPQQELISLVGRLEALNVTQEPPML